MGTLLELGVVLSANVAAFKSNMQDALGSTTNVRGALEGLGGIAAGAAAAGIGALGAATAVSISNTTDWANELDGVQDIIGGTDTQAAGLAVMMDRIGGSSDDMTNAMKKMSMGLTDAKGELGPTGEALDKLGISTLDSNGKMKDAYTLFGEVADATVGMEDGLEKSQVLMDVFGKSGAELGDALGAAANGGMAEFQSEAENMGLAIDPGPVIEMEKNQKKLDQTVKGLSVTFGSSFIPIIGKLATGLQETLADPAVQEGIKGISDAVGQFASDAIDSVPKIVDTLKEIGKWFEDNKPVVVGALAIITAGFIAWGISAVVAMAPIIIAAAPVIAIVLAIGVVAGLLYAAWTTNFGGIQEKTAAVWNWIVEAFERLKIWFTMTLPLSLAMLKAHWDSIWKAVGDKIDEIFLFMQPLIDAFKSGLEGDWTKLGDLLKDVWEKAWEKIKTAFTDAKKSLGETASNLVKTVKGFFTDTDWAKVGMDIITGIGNGIGAAGQYLASAAYRIASDAFDALMRGLEGKESVSTPYTYQETPDPTTYDSGDIPSGREDYTSSSALNSSLRGSTSSSIDQSSSNRTSIPEPMEISMSSVRAIGKNVAEQLALVQASV